MHWGKTFLTAFVCALAVGLSTEMRPPRNDAPECDQELQKDGGLVRFRVWINGLHQFACQSVQGRGVQRFRPRFRFSELGRLVFRSPQSS